MIVAYLIRRFDLQMYETSEKDMAWDDMVVAWFHGDFKVLTKRRVDC